MEFVSNNRELLKLLGQLRTKLRKLEQVEIAGFQEMLETLRY